MYKYRVELKHDDGITVLRTSASDDEALYKKIMEVENCPKRSIKILDKQKVEKED